MGRLSGTIHPTLYGGDRRLDGQLKRGSVVTVAALGDYGKLRPAVVVQSDFFREHPSITLCLITSDLRDTPRFRLTVHPSPENGLQRPSQIMVDKIMTVSRDKMRDVIGRLDDKTMVEVNRTLALWVVLVNLLLPHC
ncbi:MAG: growth inhibitor PemK [Sulfobacillus benefaciens]|uniref:Growth inhibitor PemK n=1 Tax=Sulfobacillus benefaciens TaxID=453960 RepID=A0A2T2XHH9_9FIRM|nr:MAG: growth inhibitor PemK [Sulfobacillus benefaciens]